ncbi:MAG: hypothetical protein KIT84_39325 [Labilithrix sp.]|nr:hypothetical protein [Labilithrix sp.]MCW5817114.1 hypothetical protein [Labilithrix sp.]
MKRRLFVIIAIALATTASDGAFAEEPATPAAPAVKLEVTPTASGPWTMKITNGGEGPVRLAADPRLLSFELVPPGGGAIELDKPKKGAPAGPIRCALPDESRPSTDEGRELVVPGKRSWSATFDPFFYCFGARERAALVKDAQVKARFGWRPVATKGKTAAAPSPPFALSPVGASVGKIDPVKELEADPVTLPDTISIAPKPAGSEPATPPPSVYLTVPETMDAAKGDDLTTTVSLVNETDRPIALLFRPDMVTFAVSGPGGSVACGAPRTIGSPIRELFVTVGVKGKTSLSILFTATCPSGTFDLPGLYRITPKLDTTNASGRSINIKSWDDVATAKAPLLLRVRQPKRPTLTGPRPALD